MMNARIQRRLNLSSQEIELFCQHHQIDELAVFGSILRDDFRPESDLDLFVTFAPDTKISLMDLVGMQYELEELSNRKVDLIEKRAIANSENWIRRENILSTAQVIYEARPILSA